MNDVAVVVAVVLLILLSACSTINSYISNSLAAAIQIQAPTSSDLNAVPYGSQMTQRHTGRNLCESQQTETFGALKALKASSRDGVLGYKRKR